MKTRIETVTGRGLRGVLVAALAITCVACGSDDGGVATGSSGGQGGAIEVSGSWDDNWGSSSEISASWWGSQVLISYDNDANWAITQAPADDEWNPDKFSKTVWTEPAADGSWWVCTIAFGLDTEEAAAAAEDTSDSSDPATSGCGGFAWTKMFAPLEIKGSFDTNFDETYDITSVSWGTQTVVEFDNDANWAVTQNAADAEWSPEKFNKLVWTEPAADGSFWVCTVDFDKDTAADAKASTNEADDSDPANAGCGGFGWTGYSVPSA